MIIRAMLNLAICHADHPIIHGVIGWHDGSIEYSITEGTFVDIVTGDQPGVRRTRSVPRYPSN